MDFEELTIKEYEDLYHMPQFQSLLELLKERLDGIHIELEHGVRYLNNTTPIEIDFSGIKMRQGECVSLRYLINIIPTLIEKAKGGQDVK